jgi:hypothetical protein
MRDWYQKPEDEERALIIAHRFCNQWPTPIQPIKRVINGYTLNFDCINPKGLVELQLETKYRKIKFGQYPSVPIEKAKVDSATSPAILAVWFSLDDTFAYIDLFHPKRWLGTGGRRDRGDPRDYNLPMFYYPLKSMTLF